MCETPIFLSPYSRRSTNVLVLFTYPTVSFSPPFLADGNKMKANSLEYYGFSKTMHFRDELQCLESLLHFPEEVALRLTQVEHQLFYSIEPVHYIRQGKIYVYSFCLKPLATC